MAKLRVRFAKYCWSYCVGGTAKNAGINATLAAPVMAWNSAKVRGAVQPIAEKIFEWIQAYKNRGALSDEKMVEINGQRVRVPMKDERR